MALKIVIWFITKIGLEFIYESLECHFCNDIKKEKFILGSCGVAAALISYGIFQISGYKHPVLFTVLTTAPWRAIYDVLK